MCGEQLLCALDRRSGSSLEAIRGYPDPASIRELRIHLGHGALHSIHGDRTEPHSRLPHRKSEAHDSICRFTVAALENRNHGTADGLSLSYAIEVAETPAIEGASGLLDNRVGRELIGIHMGRTAREHQHARSDESNCAQQPPTHGEFPQSVPMLGSHRDSP